ncbi:hypothetical protein ACFQZV_11150 [Microbacterium koreense]|uniref:Uncharacterized protein n=1 Tax=Microbacterium koreense TaxID=323761 RepID=A0ABW2ZT62_9MICO
MNKRVRTGIAGASIAALGLAGALMIGPASPASAAAPTCQPASTYEVDGSTGHVIFYPTARCDGATVSLVVEGFSIETGSSSIFYDGRPAGTYPGYGVSIPLDGPGEYCVVVSAVWTWAHGLYDEQASAKNCVYL